MAEPADEPAGRSEGHRRPGGRSAHVRAAVLGAAVEVMLERGVDGLSIGEVARRAKMHETSIYRRWGTRAAVAVDAVVDRVDNELTDPDTGSLRDDLVALLAGIARFTSSPLGGILLQLAVRQDTPDYEPAREKFKTTRFRAGMAVLDRAAERGELRPGLDRQLAFELLIGPLYARLSLVRADFTEATAVQVVDLLLFGIAAPAPGDAHSAT